MSRRMLVPGDPTEPKSITLRRSIWQRIEKERREEEGVSACIGRLLKELLKKEEKQS